MPRSFVALGGNLGSVEQTFNDALETLGSDRDLAVGRVSSPFRTRAIGEDAGDDFVNAVAEVETKLPAIALLDRLHSVESQFGRERAVHWGPRRLDLDLIFYGEETIDQPDLQVPHPACWYRRFVLDPLAEIAGDVVHPIKRVTVAELRSRLLARPLPVALAGSTLELRGQMQARLQREFPETRLELWNADERPGAVEHALLFWLGAADVAPQSVAEFERLPLLPRMDVSAASDKAETMIRHAIQAALG